MERMLIHNAKITPFPKYYNKFEMCLLQAITLTIKIYVSSKYSYKTLSVPWNHMFIILVNIAI